MNPNDGWGGYASIHPILAVGMSKFVGMFSMFPMKVIA